MNRLEMRTKVRRTVNDLVLEKGFVSPLDVFLRLGKVTPKQVEEWRYGRVPCLERVLHGNLSQFSFIMLSVREKARELELRPSHTAYMRWGKGPKRPLRFSKSGDPNIELHYATHFLPNTPHPSLPQWKKELDEGEARLARRKAELNGMTTAKGFQGSLKPHSNPNRVGRNDPCPCGSGKKHKKCCGA
ncbi:hypothetical protein D3C81_1319080 [compost metagenome]